MTIEEVAIDVKRGQTLFLDFYIPQMKTAVEVHGEQHFKYNSHFYSSKDAFIKSKQRDRMKQEWCEKNGITLLELNYDETKEEWLKKLKQ